MQDFLTITLFSLLPGLLSIPSIRVIQLVMVSHRVLYLAQFSSLYKYFHKTLLLGSMASTFIVTQGRLVQIVYWPYLASRMDLQQNTNKNKNPSAQCFWLAVNKSLRRNWRCIHSLLMLRNKWVTFIQITNVIHWQLLEYCLLEDWRLLYT